MEVLRKFWNKYEDFLKNNYNGVKSITENNGLKPGNEIVFFSRVGYSNPPSHKSLRKEPEIVFREN